MARTAPRSGGSGKDVLCGLLDTNRDVVVWKLDGLDPDEARRPVVPSGTSLLSIVKHLAAVEYGWFCDTFGVDHEPLPARDDDFAVADDDPANILAFYARARAAADAIIDQTDLDTEGPAHGRGGVVSLRWVLAHMIEETARHAGHSDILRELIDGQVGYRSPGK